MALIATTELDPQLIAGTKYTEGEGATIVLNMKHVKDLPTLYRALAHELAHIVLHTEDHPQGFAEVVNDLTDRIRQEYEKD